MSHIIIGFFEGNVRDYPSYSVVCVTSLYKYLCPKCDSLIVAVGFGLSNNHHFWTHEVCSSTLIREIIQPNNYSLGGLTFHDIGMPVVGYSMACTFDYLLDFFDSFFNVCDVFVPGTYVYIAWVNSLL